MRALFSWPVVAAFLLSPGFTLIVLLDYEPPVVRSPPGWHDTVRSGLPERAGTRYRRGAW